MLRPKVVSLVHAPCLLVAVPGLAGHRDVVCLVGILLRYRRTFARPQ